MSTRKDTLELRRSLAAQLNIRLKDAKRLTKRFKEGDQSQADAKEQFYRGMAAAYSNAVRIVKEIEK